MNIYSLPALISFTINISIALIIILDNPKANLNRWFSAFVAMFAMWNLSEILILNSYTLGNAREIVKEATEVLMMAAPEDLSIDELEEEIMKLDGVKKYLLCSFIESE